MKLRYSATSPYVRKVLVSAMETGQDGQIERIATDVWSPETDIVDDNPLGKVPTLITDDGLVLCDSPLICEYLDSRHQGRKLIPPAGRERWAALNFQVLGSGILDAAVAQIVEHRVRTPEQRSDAWLARQSGKIAATLDHLEQDAAAGAFNGPVTLGTITLGCALGYLDFRFAEQDWRQDRPALAAWYNGFAKRPAMLATVPKDP